MKSNPMLILVFLGSSWEQFIKLIASKVLLLIDSPPANKLEEHPKVVLDYSYKIFICKLKEPIGAGSYMCGTYISHSLIFTSKQVT